MTTAWTALSQREERSYSGIFGFSAQDYSLQESMGSIQDHAAERLLPTDKAIVIGPPHAQ